jgi:inosine-uridine nucleoside N-ribohydrolase
MANEVKRQKIILDTDFGFMNDDCTTALFAMQSPVLDLLGISVVAGNYSLQQGVADALRIFELVGRPDMPVYSGAQFPLIHERSTYEDQVWGGWAKLAPPEYMMGPPAKKVEAAHSVNFIVDTVRANPGEVIIAAIGPLTNVAMAIRLAPDIIHKIKSLVIMGGAIGVLPNGHGNVTPSAEFNFWVDPEAASMVLHADIPKILVPLNIARKMRFSEADFKRIIAVDNPVTRLFKNFLGQYFLNPEIDAKKPRLYYALLDQITIAAIIQPDVVTMKTLTVDVDITKGLAYGTSYGYMKGLYISGKDEYPLDNSLPAIEVVTDIDVARFLDLYINTLAGRFDQM